MPSEQAETQNALGHNKLQALRSEPIVPVCDVYAGGYYHEFWYQSSPKTPVRNWTVYVQYSSSHDSAARCTNDAAALPVSYDHKPGFSSIFVAQGK